MLLGLLLFSGCEPGRRTGNKGTEPATLYQGQTLDTQAEVQTIAFGSCDRQDSPQDMWPVILRHQPDLWIWTGDIIYADTEDMDKMRSMYLQQKNDPGYQALHKITPIIGIWDDHDYGVNDGGKEYPRKRESQQLLLDFLDVPPTAPVRQQEGAYQSFTLGPPGRQVKILLLDARYFRDKLDKSLLPGRRYEINTTGDVLGEAQWRWLESELRTSTAQVHLIASGIQIIPEEQGYEKWANFPQARQRLLDLLARTKPKGAVLISGDRHIAELSRMDLPGLGYPLYEITSSGITHTWTLGGSEPNQYRVGPLVVARNFGLLKINWQGDSPSLRVEVYNEQDAIQLAEPLSWSSR
ncbi:MAG: alkaline phosphatase family protein [Lewinellaceae bacterium]|nr:alkaline phosphatase family protein [Lewinellaceae bacterium]